MNYPEFFDNIEKIIVYDDLSEFLGVNDGIIDISYTDIVKMAGHSCATVAGGYLIALYGLKELFKNEFPKRGYIKVELKKSPRDENSGVIANILSMITGATNELGFGGIPTGKFNRRDLLFFNSNINSDVCFTRIDTNEKVYINYNPQKVVNPMKILMSAIKPDAKKEDIISFPQRFQEMVKNVFENSDIVIEVKK